MLLDDTTSPAEQWRELPGSEGRYEVSDYGRVRSYRQRSQPLYNKSFVSKIGYAYYNLRMGGVQKNYAAHRLVMLAFVGPSALEVNHLDGDKLNNCLGNLEYITHKANIQHSITVLGRRWGAKAGLKTETDVDREIRSLAASGISQRELARRYKVSQPYISYIVSGKIRAAPTEPLHSFTSRVLEPLHK